jgi:DNA-binding transcriptional LysR family regulator
MQLDVIQLFCDVAQHRSVSRAAESHGVTQSAVSQRIMALEKDLGVTLIDRSKRPLQLTDAGETYYHGCRKMLDQYERLTWQITGATASPRGMVRVAAIYSAGIDLLNRAVDAFESQHDRVQIEVQYHQPDQVHDLVRSDQVDLGILSYPRRWRDLSARALRDEEMAVVCRADHALAARRQVGPADLADQPLVMFDPALPISRGIAAYLRRHQVSAQIAHSFDNIDTIKVYLRHSDEAAILPVRTVQPEVAEGELAAVALRPLLTRPVALVHNRQRQLTPVAEAFARFALTMLSSPEAAASGAGRPTAATTS